MEDHQQARPWMPKPFTIAVLDSDEHLADELCSALQEAGFDARAYYDMQSMMQAHERDKFDAYVLDYLADWKPESNALETLVDAIRVKDRSDAPILILGNHGEPERVERLANILMHYKVRYLMRPLKTTYLVKRLREAIAKRAGL